MGHLAYIMTGKKLRRFRENVLCMTQGELAEEIGASRRSIGRWETEGKKPRPVYIRQIRQLAKEHKGAA